MNRWLSWFVPLTLGIALMAAFLLPAPLVPGAQAQAISPQFDIDTPVVPGLGWAIPQNGSVWHELYPVWCTSHPQTGYYDNDGDGVVSVCDDILEPNMCWHVDAVTTTYFFSPVAGGGQSAGEPAEPTPDPSPVCEMWHIVFADGPPFTYCQSVHIDGWEDNNQNGQLDVCDNIQIGGLWYHIDRIGCDVTVSPNPATDTNHSTWGWLKNLFRQH